ncbi:uncharacterized protein LOC123545784 isoform X2 [Mercenaria mercenaria]|uniref:uncharacterized protein LOC123545784 isoform X2 n=1 Tax=Mercenaria mercenaria TaxID=6596 RepID=UPI00234E54CE|nr:uncharacterized protein LOC123545784 isoform X2 [Mercenaria mercenaria]
MDILLTILLFTRLLLSVEAADKCGDRCSSTQVCLNDGTCVNHSDLVNCGLHYCKKGQDCCGFLRCMPAGDVCCGNNIYYCKSGHTCCGLGLCCLPGYFCENRKCVPDRFSTRKPSSKTTTKSITRSPTAKPTERSPTAKPTERSPTAKPTRRFNDYTTRRSKYRISLSSTFRWWYGVIIAAAGIFVLVIIVLVALKCRRSRSNVNRQSGRVEMTNIRPDQINWQQQRNNRHIMVPHTTVPIQPNRQPAKKDIPFVITKAGVPMQ